MDSILNQDEILLYVLSFTVPRMLPVPPQAQVEPTDEQRWGLYYDEEYREQVKKLNHVRDSVRQGFSWVASLRTVNRAFRNVIDRPTTVTPYSNLWFLSAVALELDPPIQLYAEGTYQQVCKIFLADKVVQARQGPRGRTVRTICFAPIFHQPNPRQQHPSPDSHCIRFPEETASKIHKTVMALETFLRSINYTTRSPLFHRNALQRYKMFLRLKQLNPNTWLVPTADIQFCWLAHIFRTKSYWNDMAALGLDPHHSLLLAKNEVPMMPEAVKGTKTLWNKTFGPSCPYVRTKFSIDQWWSGWSQRRMLHEDEIDRMDFSRFLPEIGPVCQFARGSLELPKISLSEEEVQADLEWFPELQRGLDGVRHEAYNVAGESGLRRVINYQKLYAKNLVPSYERFLNLCHKEKIKGDAAPPCVLDLIWHAHQADPVAYKEDCLSLFGREFWHHPWPNGLGVMTPLTDEFRCAWKQAYGSTIEEDWELSVTPPPDEAGNGGDRILGMEIHLNED